MKGNFKGVVFKMKKFFTLFLTLTCLTGCTVDDQLINATPLVSSVPSATTESIQEEATLNLNSDQGSNELEVNVFSKPYEDSLLNALDFSMFFKTIPAGPCSGDLTKEMCIEMYGEKSAIPEELELVNYGEDNGYHLFQLNNNTDGSTIKFGIISETYDSILVDFEFLLDDQGHSKVLLYFYYDNQILEQHPDYYDIEESMANWGGVLIYHTAYFLTQDEITTDNPEIKETQNGYNLIKTQNFYCDKNSSEQTRVGCEYIQNLEMVKFVGE